MNSPAIDLYMANGIDLSAERLEIAVCAQHNNGGLAGNIWWESNVKHFFPVGEVNGAFGVYRPGGSALNSTQTGSLRAAQYISSNYRNNPIEISDFTAKARKQLIEKINMARAFMSGKSTTMPESLEAGESNAEAGPVKRYIMRCRMSRLGAHIRSYEGVLEGIRECAEEFRNLVFNNAGTVSPCYIPDAFRYRDALISQFAYLSAIKEYIESGGKSRGSYMVYDKHGVLPADGLPEKFRFSLGDGELMKTVCEIGLEIDDGELSCYPEWKPVRPIPDDDDWFENVWNACRDGAAR